MATEGSGLEIIDPLSFSYPDLRQARSRRLGYIKLEIPRDPPVQKGLPLGGPLVGEKVVLERQRLPKLIGRAVRDRNKGDIGA